jgi:septal ring factor EnvC (AmiA/AmiB activator)
LRRTREEQRAEETRIARRNDEVASLDKTIVIKESACQALAAEIQAIKDWEKELDDTIAHNVFSLTQAPGETEFRNKVEEIRQMRRRRDDLKQQLRALSRQPFILYV